MVDVIEPVVQLKRWRMVRFRFMSSFYLVGFFELTSGRRSPTSITRGDGAMSRTWHCYYDVELLCSQAATPSFQAQLRMYSEPGDVVQANHTITFVLAKVHIPVGDAPVVAELEGTHIVPLPGDPQLPTYSSQLPNFWFPLAFAHGVVGAAKGGAVGAPVGLTMFSLTVKEYVRGSTKETILM
jgi:hypothetical protein